MIPTLFFFPLALLTIPITAQSSPSSAPNTPIPSSSTETIVDVSSTFTSTYSADFSSGLPGIVLSTFTSGRQNATATSSTTTQEVTAIVGLSPSTESSNGTASSTTTSARPSPTNTQPCNGYVEFCQRRFSNISMVVAHNSPFVRPHNAASNQDYPVLNQLNDGVRGCKRIIHDTRNSADVQRQCNSRPKNPTRPPLYASAIPPVACSTWAPSNHTSQRSKAGSTKTRSKSLPS